MKDEFLATVSHELRTPLNAVLGWSRMLGSKQLAPERATTRDRDDRAQRGRALAHMIDDLLDLSRIVAGTFRLALAARRSRRAWRRRRSMPSGRWRRPGTWNSGSPRPRRPRTNQRGRRPPAAGAVESARECDQVHSRGRSCRCLHRVLERPHRSQGRRFRPRHLFGPSAACLRAPPPGRRRDDGTSQSGLGLGLAIVRQLVELHGGSVRAASEGEGRRRHVHGLSADHHRRESARPSGRARRATDDGGDHLAGAALTAARRTAHPDRRR
mgnify:CR=1 FL=1